MFKNHKKPSPPLTNSFNLFFSRGHGFGPHNMIFICTKLFIRGNYKDTKIPKRTIRTKFHTKKKTKNQEMSWSCCYSVNESESHCILECRVKSRHVTRPQPVSGSSLEVLDDIPQREWRWLQSTSLQVLTSHERPAEPSLSRTILPPMVSGWAYLFLRHWDDGVVVVPFILMVLRINWSTIFL